MRQRLDTRSLWLGATFRRRSIYCSVDPRSSWNSRFGLVQFSPAFQVLRRVQKRHWMKGLLLEWYLCSLLPWQCHPFVSSRFWMRWKCLTVSCYWISFSTFPNQLLKIPKISDVRKFRSVFRNFWCQEIQKCFPICVSCFLLPNRLLLSSSSTKVICLRTKKLFSRG